MDNTPNRRIEDKRAEGELEWDGQSAPAGAAPNIAPERFTYVITARAAHVGGGWRLQLLEDQQEVGGGVYPITDEVTSDEAHAEALEDGEAWLMSRGEDPADPRFVTGAGSAERREGVLVFSSAAPSAASIEGLTRYDDARSGMAAREGGRYVMFDDVSALLATQSAKQGAQPSATPYAYEQDNGADTELIYAAWFAHGYGKMDPECTYRPLFLEPGGAPTAQVQADVRDPAKGMRPADALPEDGQSVIVLAEGTDSEPPALWDAQWLAGSKTFESSANGWLTVDEVILWFPKDTIGAKYAGSPDREVQP